MKKTDKNKFKKIKEKREGNVYIPPEIEVTEEKKDVDDNEK